MNVIVGIDDSERTEQVLRTALKEAELRDDALHVVHVLQPPLIWSDALGTGAVMVATDPGIIDEIRRSVWGRAGAVLNGASVNWVQVDRVGYPADELVQYAKEVDAELVVVGSRGRGDLAALILGSTSHRVSNICPCNVLIVKG